jgi:hypothetical protein
MDPLDRCDHGACNARALVRAEFGTGALDFCGHHWRALEPAARPRAVFVCDEGEELLPSAPALEVDAGMASDAA